jgi:hypothetical protein
MNKNSKNIGIYKCDYGYTGCATTWPEKMIFQFEISTHQKKSVTQDHAI